MTGAPRRRLLLDVTTVTRWVGPAVGIVRVEHALAMAALRRDDAAVVVEDRRTGAWHGLAPRWAGTVLGWSGLLDRHEGRGFPRDLLSRQGAVMALERWRLTTQSRTLAIAAGQLQRAILALRPHRFPFSEAAGGRIANVPTDMALGPAMRLGPGDTLLLAGGGWSAARAARLAARRAAEGFAIAALCYDIIPITHPQFYAPDERQEFAAHWRAMLPLLDQLLVTSSAIAADLGGWARREGLPLPPIAIIDLGFDRPSAAAGAALPAGPATLPACLTALPAGLAALPAGLAALPAGLASLPAGLAAGHFALFVSTLEPRKGHAMLLAAWDRLLAQGLPQRLGFGLVLVGRPGWMVDDVLRTLARRPYGVTHLAAVPDDVLAALYQGAAFCCYPSQYEGFGLPLVEAFARGRTVLSSTGGALAETAGGLARGLDPLNTQAWATALAEWIEHPQARQPYEARIAAGFRQPDWPEAASRILDLLQGGPVAGDFRVQGGVVSRLDARAPQPG